MTQPLIEAHGLTVRHRGADTPILKNVDFSISPGEIVTVVGPNGSGKSTLVRTVLGHVAMEAGRVVRQKGLRIGYVPQRVHIDDRIPMSVRRFLSLPRHVSDADASEALARTGVEGLQARQITRLSGGQFQRVLLARALLFQPQLLVLDEPTQGLDQPGIVAFYQLIDEIRQQTKAAVLMVSHDLLVVMRASDHVICLNGHVCCHGTPQAVSEAPEYQALFGADSAQTLALYRHQHDHRHDGPGLGHVHHQPHDRGCSDA
ncbi:ATP-binding cassette domain-containing protein [Paracoccus aerodenitrificans]|uniref:ATP-binding cassette domain-containing protein n=1 Tax=Paracoccus aerodenitrificans TaxID=3017781 RepID=UPI0022F10490|nr:metal ABC transporter ATP-binding protein [Paracoccus aerodenitrificans]WBU62962.1 metal ABC transporter ATP-binding protein [Paracoccus aerodenitrificans]